jgi:hypothetical protein
MASQLSHGAATPKESSSYSNPVQEFQVEAGKHEEALDYVSTSGTCVGGDDLWK